MPKKDAKYDKPVKTTTDLSTEKGRKIYKMRRDTEALMRETRDSVLEKNRVRVATEGKNGRAKSDAAEKARGGKKPISVEAKKVLLGANKPKPKKSGDGWSAYMEYK